MRRRLKYRRPQQGFVLIIVALLVPALFGLAALVIDLGIARMAQRQMQSAADSAALEGLRYQSADPTAPGLTPEARMLRRRERVRQRIADVFDDDLGATPTTDSAQFGAGPLLTLEGGMELLDDPELRVGQTMRVAEEPEARVFKPQETFQLNESNAPEGDIVIGQYGNRVEFDPSNPYDRSDFTPNLHGNSLLVRLRRTAGSSTDMDNQDQIPNVSSSGPTVPYLFAQGVLLSPTSRKRGIPVRATAIADAVPAKSAGAVIYLPATEPAEYLPGLCPFALTLEHWNDIYWQSSSSDTLVLDGAQLRSPRRAGALAGYVYSVTAGNQVVSLGQVLPYAADPQALTAAPLERPYAVYAPIVTSDGVVVGFGYVEWPGGVSNNELTLIRAFRTDSAAVNERASHVAAGNATATQVLTFSPNVNPTQVFSDHLSVGDPLLAPALRR